MSDIKNKAQGIDPNAKARNVNEIAAKSGSIYESLAIISKRSNQLSVKLKKELQSKLEEFSSATDALEEINENKEQIEISKFYERLPNPSVLALNEFMDDKIETRYKDKEDSEA